MKLLYLLAALSIGVVFAMQPAINGAVARVLGSPVSAAVISVFITLISCIVLVPVFGAMPNAKSVADLPWWTVFGGLIGVAVVAGSAGIAPVTGAAVFFVCLIAGQLFGAALIDHLGAFGLAERPMTATRLMGIVLVLAGVILVQWDR